MGGADSPWDLIDHDLVNLKRTDLAEEMLESTTTEQGQIRLDNRNSENREKRLLLEMHERRIDESVEKTYQIYCEVWEKQGNRKTADFVRAVSAHVIDPVIKAGTAGVISGFSDAQVRTNAPIEPHRARMARFKRKMERLRARWKRRLEIEAKECEHSQRASAQAASSQSESQFGIVAQRPPILGKATPLEQSTGTGESSNENNRARVDAFIRMMFDAGHKTTRKNISIVAGYKARSELWRFETGNRCTAAARTSFNRVLGLAPEEFARELRIKSASK